MGDLIQVGDEIDMYRYVENLSINRFYKIKKQKVISVCIFIYVMGISSSCRAMF